MTNFFVETILVYFVSVLNAHHNKLHLILFFSKLSPFPPGYFLFSEIFLNFFFHFYFENWYREGT